MADLFSKVARILFPASSSRLDAASCGFAFSQLYWVVADAGVVWESLVFGADAHKILDEILKLRAVDPDAVIRINDLVTEHISPRIAHRCGEMIEMIDKFVSYISEQFSRIQPSKVVGSELTLAVDRHLQPCGYNDIICANDHVTPDAIPKRGAEWPTCHCGAPCRARAIYRGVIDILEIHQDALGYFAVVTDHKTQGNILDRNDLYEHFQLISYAWLVWLHYPHIRRFRIQIYYVRYGFVQWVEFTIPEHRGQLDSSGVPLPDLFAAWETRYRIRVERILSYTDEDLNTPQPGDYCGLCDFHHLCPLMIRVKEKLGGTAFIESPEDAIRAAEELFVIQAMQKDYKQKLESHVARHGPIDFGDERPVLTYRASVGSDWNTLELFDLLTGQMGWLPERLFEDEILKVDKAKLKKAMKDMSTEEYAQVLAIASQTESQAFTFVKKKKVSGKVK
jgi:hypothetical protein